MKKEFSCKVCLRPNDCGVKNCWWCGSEHETWLTFAGKNKNIEKFIESNNFDLKDDNGEETAFVYRSLDELILDYYRSQNSKPII